MEDLKDLTVQQLKVYKQYIIGEIKKYQKLTRTIDKLVKEKYEKKSNNM